MRAPAVLMLEDGHLVPGVAYGAQGRTVGEVVVCTAMTGYQETLTDPAGHRQIVVQTAPQIGNTGWNEEDAESGRIWAAGHVVRDPARSVSSWRAQRALEDVLCEEGVVGIAEVDTRALTRHLRQHGTMRAGLFSGEALGSEAEMLAVVQAGPPVQGVDLVREVTTSRPYVFPAAAQRRLRVAALDLGIRASTLRLLAALGAEVHVLPAGCTLEDVLEVEPDGVLLSGGPGDPEPQEQVSRLVRAVLGRELPLLGVGLGHQILGRALGLSSYRMHLGHRGNNIPVLDAVTGRVTITAQNHGFALAGEPGAWFGSSFGRVQISHHCVHDGTVEGLRCAGVPALSVQFHPETSAGSPAAPSALDEFVTLMLQTHTGQDRVVV